MYFGTWYSDWYGPWFDGETSPSNAMAANLGGSGAINATLTGVTIGGSGDAGGDWVTVAFHQHIQQLDRLRKRKRRNKKEEELFVSGAL